MEYKTSLNFIFNISLDDKKMLLYDTLVVERNYSFYLGLLLFLFNNFHDKRINDK